MSNLNRTFCPAVKGAAPPDAHVLGPWLNQPRWCLATRPAHVPSSRSARMGFGCQAPATINSCQLGKARFSNQRRKQLTSCGRDGARATGRLGSRAPGAPAASVSEATGGPLAGAREAAGVGWLFCPPRAVSGPMGRDQGGVTSGQHPEGHACLPARPRFLGWTQGPGCLPTASLQAPPAQPEVAGPKTLQEQPQKGQRSGRRLPRAPQRLHEAHGEAPL